MTPDTLIRIGEALYGPCWQSELARRLHVADRTVRKWKSGESPIPTHLPAELDVLIDRRLEELAAVRQEAK